MRPLRSLLLALLALAASAPASAQTAADSALVRDAVEAIQVERTMQGLQSMVGGAAMPAEMMAAFRMDGLGDTLAAALLADLRPGLLRDALAYYRTPNYERMLEIAERQAERLSDPAALAAFMAEIENPKKGTLVDESLARRYVEAMGMSEIMPSMMRQMFAAMAEAVPAIRQEMDDEGGLDALMEQFDAQMGEFEDEQTRAARVSLRAYPEPLLRDMIGFMESDAGQYVNRAAMQATIDVMVPAFVEMMSAMAAGMEPMDDEIEVIDIDDVPAPPPPPPPALGEPEVFEIVETAPSLVGGLEGLQARVVYPEAARRAGIEGRVVVQFIVDERGRVIDPVAVMSPDDRLSEAAVAAVRESRFIPGRMRGRPVKVRFAVPITFRLTGPSPEGEAGGSVEDTRLGAVAPPPPPAAPEVYEVVQEPPVLVGGLGDFQRRLEYPAEARDAGIEGMVLVQFVVDEEGQVLDPVVLRSPSPLLSEAALAAVAGSRFVPGKQDGRPVKVRFAIPVTFRLNR